jgi:hypothetical protein
MKVQLIVVFIAVLSTSLFVKSVAKPRTMSRYYSARGNSNKELVDQLRRKHNKQKI